MSKKEAKKLAKEIVEWHEFEPQVDKDCVYCHGTGRVTHESGHNGDYYDTGCDCLFEKRKEFYLTRYDRALYEIAKSYLAK